MKFWQEPQVKVMNLKLNENIAASQEEAVQYESLFLYYGNSGVNNNSGAKYYCWNGYVQDTSVTYKASGSGRYHINEKDIGTVAGCM